MIVFVSINLDAQTEIHPNFDNDALLVISENQRTNPQRGDILFIYKECLFQLSFVVQNTTTKQIVAVCINVDARTDIQTDFGSDVILDIIEAVEDPIRQEVLQGGKQWIDSMLLVVAGELEQQNDAVKLIEVKHLDTIYSVIAENSPSEFCG